MLPFLPGPQRVNLEQLAKGIEFSKAQLELHQRRKEAWIKHGETERSLLRVLFQFWTTHIADEHPTVASFLKWHKIWYEVNGDIQAIELAQIKAQLTIQEAMLEEAQKPNLLVPRGDA